jgi:hypothetical protein
MELFLLARCVEEVGYMVERRRTVGLLLCTSMMRALDY